MSPRIVLITGANAGIGFATAKFISHACKDFHVIIASRSLDKAQQALNDINSDNLSTIQLDVTNQSSIQQAAAQVDQQFGRLDVLINNAGIMSRDDDIKTRMQANMDVNVVGPAVVADAFRPLLLRSQNPYSIYVSSGLGSLTDAADPTSPTYNSFSNVEAYRASKAALNMLMIQEYAFFGTKGLKTFALDPGLVRTDIRGTSEEARTGGGAAQDPEVPAQAIFDIIQGQRDADVGLFVHKDGVCPW
ncbi:hypothetical protein ASPWEDRAFT_53692 [Aspergillus wentii DTO 134E9]|uniref:Uncharacterized protein n=1 Tax=Aspergillus wentii DTO 134E9 TaxID=1073089 RepID=A0A1L9RAI7_ASPWE|nr:uncharacterized protein ASPWEDRAFT_53692 [Aspergillus wentii DTO 134E9]KAI9934515.1 hypothetical protein MW887_000129 [Aspergillus wentii]OJJ31931.1 hypothetical protein ASPWEDRAFT_53692 [Aspergillus wentii DTO 134E9]